MNERAREALAHLAPDLYQLIFDNSYDGIYVVDRERRILVWNEASERITGYGADEVVGRFCHDNILQHEDEAGRKLCFLGCPLLRTMDEGRPGGARVTLRRADGKRVPVDVSVAPIRDDTGEVVGGVEVFRDASAYERLEAATQRIARLTYRDYLTGVANRREISRLLDKEVKRSRRYGSPLCLLMLDVDGFKGINDTRGHEEGDKALKRVARALGRAVRDADTVGRWGGDEFVVVLPSTDFEGALALGERVRDAVRDSCRRAPADAPAVSVSVGVACYDGEGTSAALVALADAAMYEAKRAGGDRVAQAPDPASDRA